MAKKKHNFTLDPVLVLATDRRYTAVNASQVTSWIRSQANEVGQAISEDKTSPGRAEQVAIFKALVELAEKWQKDSDAEAVALLGFHSMTEEG